jgi:hypothetical protein
MESIAMRTSYAGPGAPIVNQSLRIATERLLNADPECRRQQAPAMFAPLDPTYRLLLVERLLHLSKSKCAATARAATASLADLGPAAVPVLVSKLFHARTEEGQLYIVELLGEIGGNVPPATRGVIQMDLLIALRRARSKEVAAAIAATQQHLRSVDAGS